MESNGLWPPPAKLFPSGELSCSLRLSGVSVVAFIRTKAGETDSQLLMLPTA